MPIKRPKFINNEIYHVILRGVGDSLIFKDNSDYYRGIYSLYEFNTTVPVVMRLRRQQRDGHKGKKPYNPASYSRDCWVEILCFCFMPNHIHLLLRQLKNNGISEFVRKFGAGYVGYFNKKYKRKGPLLGKFRAVHIKDDEQLKTIFVYIHSNPVALIEPHWKERGLRKKLDKIISFLENYKWSSYLDYLKKKNFPSVTERNFILEFLGSYSTCRELVKNWIEYKREASEDLTLE